MTNTYGLTDHDCLELYYCLNDEDLTDAIGTDGELLCNGMFEPSKDQLEDIRLSLQSKLEALQSGFYGFDSITREWMQHLEEIQAKLPN